MTHTLKFFYYLNIALLPGLTVLGYFLSNLRGRIPFPDGGNIVFAALVMMFMSAFAFFTIRLATAPLNDFWIFIAIVDTPVLLLLMYWMGVKFDFWSGCVMAFVIEMNALWIGMLIFKVFFNTQSTSELTADVVVGYLVVCGILLNFTMYGYEAWHRILSLPWYRWLPMGLAFVNTCYFYINSFKLQGLRDEAVVVLGPEFTSGLVIVPVWGILLLGYPIASLYLNLKEVDKAKEDEANIIYPATDLSYYTLNIVNNAPLGLPTQPQGQAEHCVATDLALKLGYWSNHEFKLGAVDVNLSDTEGYPVLTLLMANFRDRPYNLPANPEDAILTLTIRGTHQAPLSIGSYAFRFYTPTLGQTPTAVASFRNKSGTNILAEQEGQLYVHYLSDTYLCGTIDLQTKDGQAQIKGVLSCQLKAVAE